MTKVRIDFFRGDSLELDKYNRAASLLEKVINSEEFKDEVLKAKFSMNENLSNEKIYEKFISGSTDLQGTKDSVLNFSIEMYSASGRVVGYTYAYTTTIFSNRSYFKEASLAEVCCNMAHEYCHKIGFADKKYRWFIDRNAVTYTIGSIVQKIAEKIK